VRRHRDLARLQHGPSRERPLQVARQPSPGFRAAVDAPSAHVYRRVAGVDELDEVVGVTARSAVRKLADQHVAGLDARIGLGRVGCLGGTRSRDEVARLTRDRHALVALTPSVVQGVGDLHQTAVAHGRLGVDRDRIDQPPLIVCEVGAGARVWQTEPGEEQSVGLVGERRVGVGDEVGLTRVEGHAAQERYDRVTVASGAGTTGVDAPAIQVGRLVTEVGDLDELVDATAGSTVGYLADPYVRAR